MRARTSSRLTCRRERSSRSAHIYGQAQLGPLHQGPEALGSALLHFTLPSTRCRSPRSRLGWIDIGGCLRPRPTFLPITSDGRFSRLATRHLFGHARLTA